MSYLEIKPPLQIVVAVEKTRRRTQGQSNQHKLTLARTARFRRTSSLSCPNSSSRTNPLPAPRYSLRQLDFRAIGTNANNKPLLQQPSLEAADLNIAYRWRRKKITQPRNTRHSPAGSVSEARNLEVFTKGTNSLSSLPSCCSYCCPYWVCLH